jgi:hypothetical protein
MGDVSDEYCWQKCLWWTDNAEHLSCIHAACMTALLETPQVCRPQSLRGASMHVYEYLPYITMDYYVPRRNTSLLRFHGYQCSFEFCLISLSRRLNATEKWNVVFLYCTIFSFDIVTTSTVERAQKQASQHICSCNNDIDLIIFITTIKILVLLWGVNS